MRRFIAAAAQLGPVGAGETRGSVAARMCALLEAAHREGCSLVTFPELALTPFFPRRHIEDAQEVAACFETQMPGPEVQPVFDTARRLGIAFYLGYAERSKAVDDDQAHHLGYNSAILVGRDGRIAGKYRKVHLPGNDLPDATLAQQHLEPWYFIDGDLGFPVFEMLGGRLGMLICNDRRWPESWRMLGLQGAELVALGYNTPANLPDTPGQNRFRRMHHLLPMQAGAYQNGLWVVASAKAGIEDGCHMMGHSCIIAPSGEVVAEAKGEGDELVLAEIDLDACAEYKQIFDFERYRRPESYGLLTRTH